MNTVRLNAYAKLNLTLDVTGTEGGYHTVDSLVTTVDLFDRIVAKKRKDGAIRLFMHGMGSEAIPPEENHAQAAAERYVVAFGTTGADITVYKNIPIGAGLGGSSADAAGALLAMNGLYGAAKNLKPLADECGSDTGYLLRGGFARMRGRGEDIEPLGVPPELYFLLFLPKNGVSTAQCYRESDGYEKGAPRTERALALLRGGNPEWAAKLFSNDLYPAACSLEPDVKEAYRCAREFSPWGASMTGSGSAVFAAFGTRELCEWAKSRYRGGMRTMIVRTISPDETKKKNPFVLSEEEFREADRET